MTEARERVIGEAMCWVVVLMVKMWGCGGGGGELMGGRTCRSDRGSCLNEINEFNVLN